MLGHDVNYCLMQIGSVVSLWRYPVKSMLGEELNASEVTGVGLLGDRGYAVIDKSDGKAASAKNPRRWPTLFDFRAALDDGTARITLPDGTLVSSDQEDVDRILSKAFGRDVSLRAAGGNSPTSEGLWPDMPGLSHRDTIHEFALSQGTFFDAGMVHLLTTATIERFREAYPPGRFEVRRFRPNIVVQLSTDEKGFVENDWVGRTIAVGDDVRLNVTKLCSRCIMTTLPQGDLPKDPGILRTLAQHNGANAGVYAGVMCGGTIRRGDAIALE
jgi:uncharacterized protein YcbX